MKRWALLVVALVACAGTVRSQVDPNADIRDPEKTGYAIAGSAYLVLYYFGVMDVLLSENVVDPETTHLGGISGGSITAMMTCGGVKPRELFDHFTTLLDELNNSWNKSTQFFPGDGVLYEPGLLGYKSLLPPTSSAYQTCRNRVRMATSKLNDASTHLNDTTPLVFGNYQSMDDVYSMLAATSYLSCQSAYTPYTLFQNQPVMDGGYGCGFDDICPPNKRCVTIGAFYIGPHVKNPEVGCFDFNDLGSEANPDYNDATKKTAPFMPKGSLPTTCPTGPVKFTDPGTNSIAPGIHPDNPLSMSCKEWQKLAYFPDPTKYDFIYNQGKKDAQFWLDQQMSDASTVRITFAIALASVVTALANLL